MPDVRPTRFDQFAETLLRVGDRAYLHGDSVLALLGLADVNPQQIRVAVPRRVRAKLPAFIELAQVPDRARTTFYEDSAAQPVADAILKCRRRIETEQLLDAAKQARQEGLLTTTQWRQVLLRVPIVRRRSRASQPRHDARLAVSPARTAPRRCGVACSRSRAPVRELSVCARSRRDARHKPCVSEDSGPRLRRAQLPFLGMP